MSHHHRTFKADFIRLFLELESLIKSKSIRINDHLFSMVDLHLFINFFRHRGKRKGITRILTQTMPPFCTFRILGKGLKTRK